MDYITALVEDALGKKRRKTCCLSSQATYWKPAQILKRCMT